MRRGAVPPDLLLRPGDDGGVATADAPLALPEDGAALVAAVMEHWRATLPTLCRTSGEQLVYPGLSIVPAVPRWCKDTVPCVALSLDFTHWPYLRESYWSDVGTSEQVRELTRKLVVELLDRLQDVGMMLNRRFVLSELAFAHTETSMRAIFNGQCGGKPIHRETEVYLLDLSYTKTSPQALMSLYRLRNLRVLYLDHCPSLIKAGRDIFSILSNHDPIPQLEFLSVVGTSSELSHTWLSQIEGSCPELRHVYFTRKLGTKVLGFHDLVLMQTMRQPVLLPCGHIADRASALKLGYCGSLDRVPFAPLDLVPVNPMLTHLAHRDAAGDWTAAIEDYGRVRLADRCYYHAPCRHFFNPQTLFKLLPHLDTSQFPPPEALPEQCPVCTEPFASARICYPNSAFDTEEVGFTALKAAGAYSVEGLVPKKRENS